MEDCAQTSGILWRRGRKDCAGEGQGGKKK
jgi:hypothetical protein